MCISESPYDYSLVCLRGQVDPDAYKFRNGITHVVAHLPPLLLLYVFAQANPANELAPRVATEVLGEFEEARCAHMLPLA